MERVDIACSTSMLDEWHGVADKSKEMWPVLDCNAADAAGDSEFAKPGSVVRCSQCLIEMLTSENDVDSGVAQVKCGSSNKSTAAGMVDVACGSDLPRAVVIDVSCGSDAAGVDLADAGCEDLQTSDNSVLPKDQFDRHTIDLLALLAVFLALYNIIYYTVCILGLGM